MFLCSVSSCAHRALDEIIVWKCGHSLSSLVPLSEQISQGSEFHTTSYVVIKGDLPLRTESLDDAVHGLWAQSVAHGSDCLVHLLGVHGPTLVTINGHEVLLPAIEHGPQLLELVEAHST